MQVRVSERERIARDLHDTLLQGFQGLMLRFQAIADGIPEHEPARQQLEQVLVRADEVLIEGRDRVAALRMPSASLGNLAQTLAGVGQDLAQNHPSRFSLVVQGEPRELVPLVHEEVCFTAREAMFNAFQHARATGVVVEIHYGERTFGLKVRDDGRGIPAGLLQDGAPDGHWGMAGMRERAQRAGGRLQVWSRPGAGTEVQLEVPADRAYAGEPGAGGFARLGRLFDRLRSD